MADGSNITVLKRYCSPAQHFSFIHNFTADRNGEYSGEIADEVRDFMDAADFFEQLTGISVDNGANNMKKLLQRENEEETEL